jgi:hypothetical protein
MLSDFNFGSDSTGNFQDVQVWDRVLFQAQSPRVYEVSNLTPLGIDKCDQVSDDDKSQSQMR